MVPWLRVLVAVSAAVAGALAAVLLAAWLYGEVWATTGCTDMVHPTATPSCAMPTAPWWLLVGAAILGGTVSVAAAAGLLARFHGRRHGP